MGWRGASGDYKASEYVDEWKKRDKERARSPQERHVCIVDKVQIKRGGLSSKKNKETTVTRYVFVLITASSRMNWQCVQMQSRMMSFCSCQIHWAKTACAHTDSPAPLAHGAGPDASNQRSATLFRLQVGGILYVPSYPQSPLLYTRRMLECVHATVTKPTRAHLPSGELSPNCASDVNQVLDRPTDRKAGRVQWCFMRSSGHVSLYSLPSTRLNGQLLETHPLRGSLGRRMCHFWRLVLACLYTRRLDTPWETKTRLWNINDSPPSIQICVAPRWAP